MTDLDRQPPDASALAALEDQRDFLLSSLEDLERERAAGDVDEHDYATLKDDYTARAASVLRAIEAGRARTRRSRRRPSGRQVLMLLAVVLFAGLAGVLVAQAVGRRDSGGFSSGDIRSSVTENLNEAGQLLSDGDWEGAVERYDEVLVDQPTNAEALAYKGWTLFALGGDREAGLSSLIDAATADSDYPDAHAFLAIIFFRSGLVEQADRELSTFESLDPPPAVRQLTEGLRAEIDAALSTTTTAGAQPGGGT